MNQKESKMQFSLFFAWVVSLSATLGSLFFSEVMSFIPCTLCWYQRIFMYPLVFILLVGILNHDKSVFNYAFILTLVGTFFAIYHNFIHFGIIPEEASPCVMGVPCSTKYIEWLGFITIPLLSFIAFLLILISLIIFKRTTK